jgi:hypothetical protein
MKYEQGLGESLEEILAQVNIGIAGQIEQKIRVILNDKPALMPDFIWEKMCQTVISMDYYPIKYKPYSNTKADIPDGLVDKI